MNEPTIFHPPRSLGLAVNLAAMVVLAGAGLWGLWSSTRYELGADFLIRMLGGALALALVPVFAYRAYALWGAKYALGRDGVSLRWGLRGEDIPMEEVRWVQAASEPGYSVPLPWLRWPGAILGVRPVPEGGKIEFMAADPERLVLVATSETLFAISPEDPGEFLQAYEQFTEMGALSPLPPRSIFPTFLLAQVWGTKAARYLLLGGLAFSLILFIAVSLYISNHQSVSLGFTTTGPAVQTGPASMAPAGPVPAAHLLLLPVLNTLFYVTDVLAGMYFYRRAGSLPLAYLAWGSSVMTPILFLGAVFFIFQAA